MFFTKIQAAIHCPATRSTIDDSKLGKDIYYKSIFSDACDFVMHKVDDVELVDFVDADPSKMMWHCADIQKAHMLQLSIVAALKDSQDSSANVTTKFVPT